METLSLIGTIISYTLGGLFAIFCLCVLPTVFLFGTLMMASPAAGFLEVIQGLWRMLIDGAKDIKYKCKSKEGSILEVFKLFGLEILYLMGITLCIPVCLAFSLLAIGMVLIPIFSIISMVSDENLLEWVKLTIIIAGSTIYIVATIFTAIAISKEQPQYCR